MRLYQVAS